MKKSWKRILAVAAILALVLCVLSGCSDNTQAKIDEAVNSAKEALIKEKDEALAAAQTAADEALKNAQDAADAAKAELEGQVADLTEKLTAAEETAKTAAEAALKEKDEALAAAQTAADEALNSAQEAAETAKAELEGQVKDLTDKLAASEEAAKAAAEAAVKEKDEALAAAKTAADEALKSAQDAADATKAELEGKVADLTKQVEDVTNAAAKSADEALKTAQEAAEAAKTELEGKVDELTKKLEEAEAAAKTAAEAAAAEKAELEAQVKDLTEKLTAAEEAAKAPAEEPAAEEKAEEPAAEEKTEEPAAEAPAAMSHADYIAAELDSEVCVETYVQATQSWWDEKITVYAQSEDGGYFIYNMACSEEDAAKLVPGTKIRVKGFKSEWAGEVEITDAAFEILEGDPFIAEPEDITALLGKDELKDHQNEKVLFKGLTVAAQDDGEAINYKNATEKTDDIYVRFTNADGEVFNFCVEFYLTGKDTDSYKAVEGLQVGDVVDVEGFLYWYEGPNTHITGVTKAE